MGLFFMQNEMYLSEILSNLYHYGFFQTKVQGKMATR